MIALVEVSIAYAEDWKNRDLYPSDHDWLGAHKTERERERQRERERERERERKRGGLHNKSE